jgi:ketosteroid isomerase-like protein
MKGAAVLIADDLRLFLEIEKSFLVRAGFDVLAAETGERAVELETAEVGGKGDVVYEVGTYTLFGDQGQAVDNGKYVVVWKRERGAWKLHRDIWNSSRPAAEP